MCYVLVTLEYMMPFVTGRRRVVVVLSSSGAGRESKGLSPTLLSVASDSEHAATLLARMDQMRGQNALCDIMLRPEDGAPARAP